MGAPDAPDAPPDAAAMIALVKRYFAAVDGEDMAAVLATLSADCRFTVETHRVVLHGHAEISGMFTRLWRSHDAVQHDHFQFVSAPSEGRIAAQFRVVNTLHSGQLVYKSNCNFFTITDGRFSTVAVYMAGENTLDKDS